MWLSESCITNAKQTMHAQQPESNLNKQLTSTLLLLCRRPERAFSRVVFPAPGGPNSRVNLPGYKMLFMVSRMVNRCESSFSNFVFRKMPCRTNEPWVQVPAPPALLQQLLCGSAFCSSTFCSSDLKLCSQMVGETFGCEVASHDHDEEEPTSILRYVASLPEPSVIA